jgi:ribonucleotide reductase alpha subunit
MRRYRATLEPHAPQLDYFQSLAAVQVATKETKRRSQLTTGSYHQSLYGTGQLKEKFFEERRNRQHEVSQSYQLPTMQAWNKKLKHRSNKGKSPEQTSV